MPRPFLKNSRPRQRLEPSGLASPVNIPEILERILSYCNEPALRSACFVNRQWFSVGRELLVRELVYESHCDRGKRNQQKILSNLRGAGRFLWLADSSLMKRISYERDWKQILMT